MSCQNVDFVHVGLVDASVIAYLHEAKERIWQWPLIDNLNNTLIKQRHQVRAQNPQTSVIINHKYEELIPGNLWSMTSGGFGGGWIPLFERTRQNITQ